uniref:Secreted protein n=1 Tax=Panagrolaimus sp. PS1159 TaxID=55785 RepID=A0AC35GVJ2_9BILA
MKIIIPVSRLRRLTYWILCFYLFSISNLVYCQENSESHSNPSPTRRPQNFVTGKLNQFNGFYTPRPLPSNANFGKIFLRREV